MAHSTSRGYLAGGRVASVTCFQRGQVVLVQRVRVTHQCLLDGKMLDGIEISDLSRRFPEVFAAPAGNRSHAHVGSRFVWWSDGAEDRNGSRSGNGQHDLALDVAAGGAFVRPGRLRKRESAVDGDLDRARVEQASEFRELPSAGADLRARDADALLCGFLRVDQGHENGE